MMHYDKVTENRNGEKGFNQLTDLEEAEMLILEIEKGKLNLIQKYDNLLKVAHKIIVVCLDFASYNNVSTCCDKYVLLGKGIPISEILSEISGELFLQTHYWETEDKISVEQLKTIKAELENGKEDVSELAALEFVANLVYISLKEILGEVKTELGK